ncbi:MAG: hypothetical protein ACRDTC_26600 [Pseudonocardiaceae bacterium]
MAGSTDLDEQVLGWLSPDDRDPTSVSQHDAQQLAWYTAPGKWITLDELLPEVATACARLLEMSGRYRGAAALREHTPAVLAGWARSPQAGIAAYRRAMQATGVQPPDTAILAWAPIMGHDEAGVLDAAKRMLESALDSGALTPGRRGWRATQRDLVDAWLRAPSILFAGRTPIDVVHAERAAHWADAGTTARRAILRAVLPRLTMVTGRTSEPVEPLRFLLDAVSNGFALTPTGRLPPALVRDAAARFGWGLPAFTIRKESDVTEVVELRDLATRARLIAVRKRQLVLTPTGRAALDDPAQLWNAAAAGWFDHDDFAAHIAEIAAATLLDVPVTAESLTLTAHGAVAASFRHRDGAQPDHLDARIALWEWLRPGHAFGWLTTLSSGEHQLTTPGRAAALVGLGHRSHAARNYP